MIELLFTFTFVVSAYLVLVEMKRNDPKNEV